MQLDDNFSLRSVIRVLVRIRIQVAARRRDRAFFQKLVNVSRNNPPPEEIDSLLPPRRTWSRYRPDRKTRAGKPTDSVNTRAIHACIQHHLEEGTLDHTLWGAKLLQFTGQLRERLDHNTPLSSGKIVPMARHRSNKFRLIHRTENLQDRVFLNLIARYLRGRFDDELDSCVYAFRHRGERSHSVPVARLLDYRRNHAGEVLYSAEADIQKFFDTIGHPVVEESVARFVEKIRNRGEDVDPRALAVIQIALDNYSFDDALEQGRAELRSSGRDHLIATPPEELLSELREKFGPRRFGLPQGGSLSPLLANLVLSHADSMVKAVPGSEQSFYARYCDDILIVHPDENVCQGMLDEYLKGLSSLGLSAHEPSREPVSEREFFDEKTLLPYRWASPAIHPGSSRWVSFLGYHIGHDGNTRLRKSTVRNEHDKQIQLVDRILRTIDNNMPAALLMPSDVHVHFRAAMRMIAMSTGKNRLRTHRREIGQPCWSDAFPLLESNRSIAAQLRNLDHGRERQLRRLRRGLGRRGISADWPKEWRPLLFTHLGAPFSYHSLLRGRERPGIPDPPLLQSNSQFSGGYK